MFDNFTTGQHIRYLRNMKKLNQCELARGICSPSYLSKIETDSLSPSIEIKELLLKRLGYYEPDEASSILIERRLKMLHELLVKNLIIEADDVYEELVQTNLNGQLKLKLDVISLFYFVKKSDFIDLPKLIEKIFYQEIHLSTQYKYYFYKGLGYYYYYSNKFEEAFSFFDKSILVSPQFQFSPIESAEIYYAYALTASRIKKIAVCLKYCQKSLELFQSVYSLKRCVDCHVLLGITFRRMNQYEEATRQYEIAWDLAKKEDYKGIYLTIQHNLGYSYALIGESEKAIKHYYDCLTNPEDISPSNYVQTTLALITELYKSSSFKDAKSWLQKGLAVLEKNKFLEKRISLEYKFYEYLISGEFILLEKLMILEVIPILEKEKQFDSLSLYAFYLATHFNNLGKYKKAASYFSLSRDYLYKSTIYN
jgi:tetratricopeptide (TPR) repeat protein